MLRRLGILCVAMLLVVATSDVHAQGGRPGGQGGQGGGRAFGRDFGRGQSFVALLRVQEVQDEVELTETQKEELEDILVAQRAFGQGGQAGGRGGQGGQGGQAGGRGGQGGQGGQGGGRGGQGAQGGQGGGGGGQGGQGGQAGGRGGQGGQGGQAGGRGGQGGQGGQAGGRGGQGGQGGQAGGRGGQGGQDGQAGGRGGQGGQGGQGGGRGGQGGQSGGEDGGPRRGFQDLSEDEIAEMRDQAAQRTRDAEDKIEEVLEEAQLARLIGIYIQVSGTAALNHQWVADPLDLSRTQREEIAVARQASLENIRTTMQEAFQGAGGDREAAFARLRELNDEANEAILATLTDGQREKLEEMKGAEFEMPQRRFGGESGQGGRGGGPGGGDGGDGGGRPQRPGGDDAS